MLHLLSELTASLRCIHRAIGRAVRMKAVTLLSFCTAAFVASVAASSAQFSSSHVADLGSDFDEKVRDYDRLPRPRDRCVTAAELTDVGTGRRW